MTECVMVVLRRGKGGGEIEMLIGPRYLWVITRLKAECAPLEAKQKFVRYPRPSGFGADLVSVVSRLIAKHNRQHLPNCPT